MKKQLFALTLLLTPVVAQAGCEVCYGRMDNDTSVGYSKEQGTETSSTTDDMDGSGDDYSDDYDSGADEDDSY